MPFLTKHGGTIRGYFTRDNFTSRRTTGHNMYDPESLLTGAEVVEGLDYGNSTRDYLSQGIYDAIVHGNIPVDDIPRLAPRILIERYGA